MTTVTVYRQPPCVQCNATCRALEARGIAYQSVELSHDAEAVERVHALGHLQGPVVMTGEEHWCGFRPDKIEELAEQVIAERGEGLIPGRSTPWRHWWRPSRCRPMRPRGAPVTAWAWSPPSARPGATSTGEPEGSGPSLAPAPVRGPRGCRGWRSGPRRGTLDGEGASGLDPNSNRPTR
jgi:glutaredoxin-like protein NrdH